MAHLRRLVDETATAVGFDLVAVTTADEFGTRPGRCGPPHRRRSDGRSALVHRGAGAPRFKSRMSCCPAPAPSSPWAGATGRRRKPMPAPWARPDCPLRPGPGLPPGDETPDAPDGPGFAGPARQPTFAARWYVDDGPMLDRAAAARAGLGWFGKNGNILNPTYGSWILLGQTNHRPAAGLPTLHSSKTCGQCVALHSRLSHRRHRCSLRGGQPPLHQLPDH